MSNVSKLRLYSFCNAYLSSIQQGIQTAHVVGRMAKFYQKKTSVEAKLFWEWLEEGRSNETIIVCNGGMAADIFEAYMKFESTLTANGIPSNIFFEESRALGVSSPTCWACVLPEEIYNAKFQPPGRIIGVDNGAYLYSSPSTDSVYEIDHPLFDFLAYKNGCSLAR